MINPFIGYFADKISLRYFVIFAPAVTAVLISSIGFTDTYLQLALLLFATGISVACFHAPAPAMIGRVAGSRVGLGMSMWMAAGELARSIGPLLAVWAVTIWTLDGFYRIVVLGLATSFVLFWRLHNIPASLQKPGSLIAIGPKLRSLFIPIAIISLFRNFISISLTTYLPTYLNLSGSSLVFSGSALSILELAGVAGALTSGTISDRFGRKVVLLVTTIGSTAFMFVFLNVHGWMVVPVLILLGFFSLSAIPVMMAIVQDQLPKNRAMGNGLFMFTSFLLQPVAIMAIGVLGDRFGLHTAFYWSAWISLLAIPGIFALPSWTKHEIRKGQQDGD